jgi:hypothetical protein
MRGATVHAGFYQGLPVEFLATCIPMVQRYRTLDAGGVRSPV